MAVADVVDAVLCADESLAAQCDRSAILAALAAMGATSETSLRALVRHCPRRLDQRWHGLR
jgi:hypothetical protein